MGDPIISSGVRLPKRRSARHSRLIGFQKGDVIAHDQKLRHFQFAFGGLLKRALGLAETIEENVAPAKIGISEDKILIEINRLFGLFPSCFILSEALDDPGQKPVRIRIARISLRPQLAGLLRLLQFPVTSKS